MRPPKLRERTTVSDADLTFQQGYPTQEDGRPTLKLGCLPVLVACLGWQNRYQHCLPTLDVLEGVLFIDDGDVIGYRDVRPD